MVTKTPGQQLSFSIINTKMTVEAMRSSGYKSTTHALAELIDNSIESGATAIEIFGISEPDDQTGRVALKELAVLDNGSGMDPATLRGSLRYGYGTRSNRRGIGRFGVGLPNSSMSQATRVDIWSWQAGAPNALHTWLSLEDVEEGREEIPEPQVKAIPDVYLQSSLNGFEDSGCLVVWSDLDRVEWRRAATTFRHTEALLGRIYRRFLARPSERLHPDDKRGGEIGSQRTITCIPVEWADGAFQIQNDDVIRVTPNDPLYLMNGTSCPEEFGNGPMFAELEGSPFTVPVTHKGQSYDVRLRASYARAHARNSSHPDATWPEQWVGRDAGNTPWGKHAGHNMGVSMVRSHRELEVDPSWVNQDPTERWWTVEVDFPAGLDEVFGVTNNKQGTMTFQRLGQYDWQREVFPNENSIGDVRRRMEEDGDPRVDLLALHNQMSRIITALRNRAKQSTQPRKDRHQLDEDQKADAKTTAAIKRRLEEGHKGESDLAGEIGTKEEHIEEQVRVLVEKHLLDKDSALKRVIETIEKGNRVSWILSAQERSPAFFDVEPLPNLLQVVFNTKHPVHSYLYDLLHPDIDERSEEDVRESLRKAAAAFKILFYSWARFEEEQSDGDKRRIRNARLEWGKYAEEFFDEDDSTIAPTDLV